MRILLIQDFLRSGGTERQTVSLALRFARSGHDVCILTFRPGGELADWVGRAGLALRALQRFDTGLNFFAPGIFRAVERSRPDVILCMGRMANSYAGFLRRRFKQTVIVATARTGKPLPLLNQWSFRHADAVLANCRWWGSRLVESGLVGSKVKVVHNGLASSWERRDSAAARDETRNAFGAGPETVVFLNVANFRKGKRHAWLIEAFSRVCQGLDCQLWLVGDGEEWRRCRRMVESSEVSGQIKLLGHRSDTYPYYAGADVAVSGSLEDSLPNFLIEAQSIGLPAIATDVRGVGETFSNGDSGFLVAPDDRREFSSRIVQLCVDHETRGSMGEMAAEFARRNFCGNSQAAKVLGFLENLVNT